MAKISGRSADYMVVDEALEVDVDRYVSGVPLEVLADGTITGFADGRITEITDESLLNDNMRKLVRDRVKRIVTSILSQKKFNTSAARDALAQYNIEDMRIREEMRRSLTPSFLARAHAIEAKRGFDSDTGAEQVEVTFAIDPRDVKEASELGVDMCAIAQNWISKDHYFYLLTSKEKRDKPKVKAVKPGLRKPEGLEDNQW